MSNTIAPRLTWYKTAPKAFQAMIAVNGTIESSTLGKVLIDLVFARVSQINGCAYCLDMHVRDLRQQGEDWQRINSLATWREVSFFNERERAALAWAETLTRLADRHEDRDAEFETLKAHFSELEIVELSIAIAQINAWNRMGVGMRSQVLAKAMP
ncbi:carboxymuconolactone decarboxylase family protein [Variovorax paradoxus]|jgi:AhpD family alkylhydroperoxidase|uniref:carboxymuconolactone decarboxylase family protein n=1 Tax=Variovorax paradoxus TaxID=34073 RepID=UPI00278A4794|nr:carboxymuconolactone decarboxylase family protein [Variovorax paradoxus]MDP9933142.1 AhpD family alkylhydroperoxidase [Variovorax paradoxus]